VGQGAVEIDVAEIRRDQQKLWLILFQIKGVRARLNFLALQRSFFGVLAVVVIGAAMVFEAALYLSPLSFLIAVLAVALFAMAGAVREARRGLRALASPGRAAAIADRRGMLKGRLATVLALTDAPNPSPLWPYLVEDAYSLRELFAPSQIEPRWISRSIFALLAACLFALVMVIGGIRGFPGIRRSAARAGRGQVTADIGNLEIRPADPALEPNAEIYADAKTLRKLQSKLNAAQSDADKNSLSRWMDKARNLAGGLQNELTGRPKEGAGPPLRLQLTDKNPGQNGDSAPSSQEDFNHNGNNSGGSDNLAGNARRQTTPPTTSMQGQEADRLAGNQSGGPRGEPGSNPADPAFQDFASGGPGGGEGSSHGAGSDPQGLFGPDSSQTLGTDSFKITIDAQPSDESSKSGAPAYIPPRVRVPLNPNQYPDEPLQRGSVPPADQAAVKRVFQR
jgi:hypothetical protein